MALLASMKQIVQHFDAENVFDWIEMFYASTHKPHSTTCVEAYGRAILEQPAGSADRISRIFKALYSDEHQPILLFLLLLQSPPQKRRTILTTDEYDPEWFQLDHVPFQEFSLPYLDSGREMKLPELGRLAPRIDKIRHFVGNQSDSAYNSDDTVDMCDDDDFYASKPDENRYSSPYVSDAPAHIHHWLLSDSLNAMHLDTSNILSEAYLINV